MKLHSFLPRSLSRWFTTGRRESRELRTIRKETHDAKMLAARLLIQQNRQRGRLDRLADAEFKVFSQFGDDGIIQYLIQQVGAIPHTFVEFGVDNCHLNRRLIRMYKNQ